MRGSLVLLLLGLLLSVLSFSQDDSSSQTKLVNGGGACGSGLDCAKPPIVQGGKGKISFNANVGPKCYIGVRIAPFQQDPHFP